MLVINNVVNHIYISSRSIHLQTSVQLQGVRPVKTERKTVSVSFQVWRWTSWDQFPMVWSRTISWHWPTINLIKELVVSDTSSCCWIAFTDPSSPTFRATSSSRPRPASWHAGCTMDTDYFSKLSSSQKNLYFVSSHNEEDVKTHGW